MCSVLTNRGCVVLQNLEAELSANRQVRESWLAFCGEHVCNYSCIGGSRCKLFVR